MNSYSERDRQRRVDEICLKKFGHPFLKPYESGDEHRFFLPERQANEFIVYHRYTHNDKQATCHAHVCYCYQNGYICKTCAPLNTTSFYDMTLPLDTDRFVRMKDILRNDCDMSITQIYNWLSFWIHDIIPKRYSHDSSTPFFFQLYSSSLRHKINTPYSIMSFLSSFVSKKHFKKGYKELVYNEKPSFQHVSHESVKIRTFSALIKWSIDVYSKDMYITQCQTCLKSGQCSSIFRYSSDTKFDQFSHLWKKMFDSCIVQIRDEVAYRPGKVGMYDAHQDFHHHVLCVQTRKHVNEII